MFKKFISFLYKVGILKLTTIEDKIKYLLIFDIDMYNNKYKSIIGTFIEEDIVRYIEQLNYVNNYDIYGSYIVIKKIDNDSLYRKSYSRWCSNKGNIIYDSEDKVKVVLTSMLTFIKLYNSIKKDMNLNIAYSNHLKIKPYYINIENIINDML